MKSTLRILSITIIAITILSLYQCANIVAPVGGPKDERPPSIDTANTTPNYQINYDGEPIILTFDEWIAVKDAVTQVVVSPPLQYPLGVKLKKKSVEVTFHEDEVLRENATYTINFGDAISDFTEGNVPPNLRYVFSTGDVIDSLTFSAKLIDIDSKKPIENALLMLYVNQADSVLYKTKPFYFAKTDTSGVALIENIRADTFKVVALKDDNLNYQLDGETELVNFLLEPVVVEGDTALGVLEMYIPQQPLIRRGVKNYYGKTTVLFNRAPYDLSYNLIGDAPDIQYESVEGDSLMLWYSDTTRMDWSIVIDTDTSKIDTLSITKKTNTKAALTSQYDVETKRRAISIAPDTTVAYRWSVPLAAIDPSKLLLAVDSLSNTIPATYVIDDEDQHLLKIKDVQWEEGKRYFWTISAGAVTDIFETANDSIGMISVGLVEEKSLGTVEIKFDSLDVEQHYVIELMSGSTVTRSAELSEGVQSISFQYLKPGNYTIRLIEDANRNGRWDTGDYDRQSLPERIYIKTMPPLKANWEQSIDFKL